MAGSHDNGRTRHVRTLHRPVVPTGARAGAVGHFRAVVENLNGRFSHHDGGIDDNIGRLGGILSQADIVLCPSIA